MVQPLWKAVWRLLKKLKIELPYDVAIPLLGMYPKEINQYLKEISVLPIYCSIIHGNQGTEKNPNPCVDEWI